MQFVLNAKPRQRFMPQDETGFSFKVWKIVDSKPFEIVIMILISLNAITLALTVSIKDTVFFTSFLFHVSSLSGHFNFRLF